MNRDLTQEEIDLITEAYNYTVMASRYSTTFASIIKAYPSLNNFIEAMKPLMIKNKSLSKSENTPNGTFVEFLHYHINLCKKEIPRWIEI